MTNAPDARSEARRLVGHTLGSWKLVRVIGEGPLTVSFEAYRGSRDATERGVVRLLVSDEGEEGKNVFVRSAYAASRFRHGRVLPILEDGRDAKDRPFVVRPLVLDGVSLKEHLSAHKALERNELLRLGEQLLDALEFAHAHGIVHGRVNPNNILLTQKGSVRLCDFGAPPGYAAERPALASQGSPYIAPELQKSGALAASEQGDVYSVGACLFFAAVGAEPAEEPGERLAGLEPTLARVIAHALCPDPPHRYESAYAMLGDIRRVMAGRLPKLTDASAPVPSQSGDARLVPPSSREHVLRNFGSTPPPPPRSTAKPVPKRRSEWQGNVVLLLAIAVLVGIATFVIVRERREEGGQKAHSGER